MNRRNFLGGALLSIPLLTLKWPRLKSDVPNIRVGDFGSYRCTIHDAYTGKDIGEECFIFVDAENGVTEREKWPREDGRREIIREHRWAIIRLHPDDKAEL